MSQWQSGEFDRERVHRVFHPFTPAHAVDSLEQVDLVKLWGLGKRLVLLDVDNTIVRWKAEEFAGPVLAWVEQAKSLGFDLCLVSNTRHPERLDRLSKKIGAAVVAGRFKPSRAMFRLALIKFQRKPEEAIMIGDQMMTDILGANRSNIDAIWVRKMEGKEFGPTSINRFIERLLTSQIYNALVIPEGHAPVVPEAPKTGELSIVKQIFRFLIVGGVSFIIDTGLKYLLMRWITLGGVPLGHVFGAWLQASVPAVFQNAASPEQAAAPLFAAVASLTAMYNSFFFNRLWTFEAKGKDRKSSQIARFYTISILGALFNAGLFSLFFSMIAVHDARSIGIANIFAAGIVAIWNFFGQRFFAFRPRAG